MRNIATHSNNFLLNTEEKKSWPTVGEFEWHDNGANSTLIETLAINIKNTITPSFGLKKQDKENRPKVYFLYLGCIMITFILHFVFITSITF